MEPTKKDDHAPLPPDGQKPESATQPTRARPDPTRFGDWEMNGRAIDF